MELANLCYIDATGYHYADYPTVLQYFKDKYKGIYGADTYLEADSQDGQELAVRAKAAFDMMAQGAATYNSYSPKTAQGVGLARNVKINGITKQISTKSTVVVTCVGVAGTVLTNCIAQDTLGQKWNIPLTTIPGPGTVDVIATAQLSGSISAAPNTVTTIFTPTLGWQSVNNAAAATVGVPIETDGQLRIRQTQSTALPSLTVFDGTIGAVENVLGVTAARGYENNTGSTDGNGIPQHSIAMVAAGGSNSDIAAAIQIHKTPGCNTYGSTSVPTVDSKGVPITINFSRPTGVKITGALTLSENAGWSTDYVPLIKAAFAAFVTQIGIGNNAILTKFFIPCYLIGTPAFGTFNIVTLLIGKNAGMPAASDIAIAWNEQPYCNASTDVAITL